MLAAVQWRYRVKYALNATGGTDRVIWHQGILMYYPAEQRAVLLPMPVTGPEIDAPPTALDEGRPVSAGFPRPGGRLVLRKTTVMVMSGLLRGHEDVDVDGEGEGQERLVKRSAFREERRIPSKAEPDPSPAIHANADGHSCWREILWTKDVQKRNKTWHDGQMHYEHPMATFYVAGDDDAGTTGTGADHDHDKDHEHNGQDGDGGGEIGRGGTGRVKPRGLSVLYRKVYKEGSPQEGDILECARLLIEIGPVLERPNCDDHHQPAETAPPSLLPPPPRRRTSLEGGEGGGPSLCRSFDLLYTEDRRTKKIKRWRDGRIQWNARSGRATFLGEDEQVLVTNRTTRPDELFEGNEIITGQYVLQVGAERDLLSISSPPPPPPPGKDGAQAQAQSQRKVTNLQKWTKPRITDASPLPPSLPLPSPGNKSRPTVEGNRGRSTSDLLTLLRTGKAGMSAEGSPSV